MLTTILFSGMKKKNLAGWEATFQRSSSQQCVGREHSMTAIRLYSFGPSFHDFIIPHFFAFFIRGIFPK